MYQRYIKRILDVLISILALVIASPIFLVVAIAIKLDSNGPVLFKQKRIGRGKSYFQIYKFRTMCTDAPHDVPSNDLRSSRQYITRVGKVLRVTSIDELPQLLNILKGEMAVIGPRPALWNQYELQELREKYGASDVRPGLSGWAQVNGRDYLSRDLDKKARRDAEYAHNICFLFDLKCVLLTLVKVVNRQGIVEGRESKSKPANSRGDQ